MATLTSSATFSVGAGTPAFDEIVIQVLPPAAVEQGKGSLVHPTLGTLNYTYAPTDWTNIDGDVLVPSVWSSTKTLLGSANTLFRGDIRDVTCVERWGADAGGLRMPIEMLRTLIAFYTNPPDPAVDAIEWYPNYTSAFGFKVALVSLTVGGEGITLNSRVFQGWVAESDVELQLKILGRVDV